MIYVGIDPGLDGSISAIAEDGAIRLVQDTPTLEVKGRTKVQREYQIPAMDRLLKQYVGQGVVALEDIHAFPGEAIRAAFSIGKGIGIWQ